MADGMFVRLAAQVIHTYLSVVVAENRIDAIRATSFM